MNFMRLSVVVVLLLTLAAAGFNVVRQLVAIEIAASPGGIAAYDLAISWDPSNPALYASRAEARARVVGGDTEGASILADLEKSRSLNPHNWNYLLRTGQILELLGEREAASEVFEHLAQVSPSDATDEWQLANYYLRNGQLEESLSPLKEAILREPTLGAPALTMLTQLGATRDQVASVWPDDHRANEILVRHAIRNWLQISTSWGEDFLDWAWARLMTGSQPIGREVLKEYVGHLRVSEQPVKAREAWIGGMARSGLRDPDFEEGTNRVWNGDFSLQLANSGLGWRVHSLDGMRLRRVSDRQGGAELEIEFSEDANPSFRHLEQPVIVSGSGQYRLEFRGRSEGITSDQGLYFAVENSQGKTLARTEAVRGTRRWQRYAVEFRVPAGTHFVTLVLRRDRSQRIANRLRGSFWCDGVRIQPAEG